MAAPLRPRHGSLRFYPRNRSDKFLPRVNWSTIKAEKYSGVLGVIGYKVGMTTVYVKDLTDKSMTQNKKMYFPATIIEVPNMKVFSVRFYNKGIVIKDVIVSNDKELKKLVKLPKEMESLDSSIPESYDDLRVLLYSIPKQTDVKKTPDMTEVGISGSNKLEVVKNLIGKEISLKDFAQHFTLLDSRGLTIGKGTVGPVKRFGLDLKAHKSEKGVRRPGSLGPWHPARVTYLTPMMGQLGMFTRVQYNNNVVNYGSISEKDINKGTGFEHYGKIRSNYIIIKGSIQGPAKRQILLTPSYRPTKDRMKKKYEFIEVAK